MSSPSVLLVRALPPEQLLERDQAQEHAARRGKAAAPPGRVLDHEYEGRVRHQCCGHGDREQGEAGVPVERGRERPQQREDGGHGEDDVDVVVVVGPSVGGLEEERAALLRLPARHGDVGASEHRVEELCEAQREHHRVDPTTPITPATTPLIARVRSSQPPAVTASTNTAIVAAAMMAWSSSSPMSMSTSSANWM